MRIVDLQPSGLLPVGSDSSGPSREGLLHGLARYDACGTNQTVFVPAMLSFSIVSVVIVIEGDQDYNSKFLPEVQTIHSMTSEWQNARERVRKSGL